MLDSAASYLSPWVPKLGECSVNAHAFSTSLDRFTSPYLAASAMSTRLNQEPCVTALTTKMNDTLRFVNGVESRLNGFIALSETPSLVSPTWNSHQFLANSIAMQPTSASLTCFASMAGCVRAASDHLILASPGSLAQTGLLVNTNMLPDQFGSAGICNVGEGLYNNASAYSGLADTVLATTRLSAAVFARPPSELTAFLAGASSSLTGLSALGSSVYNWYTSFATFDPNSLLCRAPTIEPYTATFATAVVAGVDESVLEALRAPSTDDYIDGLGNSLNERLAHVSTDLVEVYLEFVNATKLHHHGWVRHATISLRTLFDHLLRYLAPDIKLVEYFANPEVEKIDGEFTRNARLRYIFREVAVGEYAKMAEQDIKIAEATFFPANSVVHTLASKLSERQVRVLHRRIEGCVSVVLEAAGY